MAKKAKISDVRHVKIAGGENLYCTWPRTGGIENFGGGEITIIYTERDISYQLLVDKTHRESGSRLVLLRSMDSGKSWPKEERLVLRDNRVPFEELFRPDWDESKREFIDMSGSDSVLCVWRCYETPPARAFVIRSTDRGRTWEKIPKILDSYHLYDLAGGTQYLKRPDGTILLAMPARESVKSLSFCNVLYGSSDSGQNWYFISTIGKSTDDKMHIAYPCLVVLPSGRILSSLGNRFVKRSISWTSIVYSDDEGLTWSEPRRINRWGDNAWLTRLHDGRLLLVWGYRFIPYGIRASVSEDEGTTWSQELVIRDDGGCWDLGYPVATELDDGRIFTAYYFNVKVKNQAYRFDGPRFIGGSFFNID